MGSHYQYISHASFTYYVRLLSNLLFDVFLREQSSPMTIGNDFQTAAVNVGGIQMDSQRHHIV